MKDDTMKDIIEWDIPNWSRAIKKWNKSSGIASVKGKRVLELGGRSGGLSLYFALKGAEVVCTDLDFIKKGKVEKAKELHKKYGVEKQITYEDIDATDIPYENYFDIVCFKSVLGGVGYNDNFEKQQLMMTQIHKALKNGVYCCFVENLTGLKLIRFLRKKFRPWGVEGKWRYITKDECEILVKEFQVETMETVGVIGLLGRVKVLSWLFGKLDRFLELFIKDRGRYIVSCVCKKS